MVERHPREIKRCLREGGRALVLMDYPSRGLCIPIASFSQRTIGASPSPVIAKPVSARHEAECLEPNSAPKFEASRRNSKCLGVTSLANGTECTRGARCYRACARSLRANWDEWWVAVMALHRADYSGNHGGRKKQTSPAFRNRRRSRRSLIDRSLGWHWHVGGVNTHAIQGRSEPIERRPLLLFRQTRRGLHVFDQARCISVRIAYDNIRNALAELVATFRIRLEGIHDGWTGFHIRCWSHGRRLHQRWSSILRKS